MQSVPITTDVVSSNPYQGEVYNIIQLITPKEVNTRIQMYEDLETWHSRWPDQGQRLRSGQVTKSDKSIVLLYRNKLDKALSMNWNIKHVQIIYVE